MFDSYTTINGWRPDMPGTTAGPAATAASAAGSSSTMTALDSPSVPTSAPLPPEELGGPAGPPQPPGGGLATPIEEVGGVGMRGGAMPPGYMQRGENVYQHFRDMF